MPALYNHVADIHSNGRHQRMNPRIRNVVQDDGDEMKSETDGEVNAKPLLRGHHPH